MSDDASHYISLVDAAARLGLSTEATRKRIQRGTLAGLKIDGAWFVEQTSLPDSPDERPAISASRPDASNQAAERHRDSDGPDVRTLAETPSVDLTPLVQMISQLHADNRQLTEAATIWQLRARQAEERLAALEAGPIARPEPENADAPENAFEGPQRAEDPQSVIETLDNPNDAPGPTKAQFSTGWRRWVRRVMGYEG